MLILFITQNPQLNKRDTETVKYSMKTALVVGNGPSVQTLDIDQLLTDYKFDITLTTNHMWQQWPDFDWYCMADERNVLHTKNNATPDVLARCVTRQPWDKKHTMKLCGGLTQSKRDISGTMAIRHAYWLGATHILCVGFDSYTNKTRGKGFKDVPWEKRDPRTFDDWDTIMDRCLADVECSVKFLVPKTAK